MDAVVPLDQAGYRKDEDHRYKSATEYGQTGGTVVGVGDQHGRSSAFSPTQRRVLNLVSMEPNNGGMVSTPLDMSRVDLNRMEALAASGMSGGDVLMQLAREQASAPPTETPAVEEAPVQEVASVSGEKPKKPTVVHVNQKVDALSAKIDRFIDAVMPKQATQAPPQAEAPVPDGPTVQVEFSFPNGTGAITAWYHAVVVQEWGVVLIFDKKQKAVPRYMPPPEQRGIEIEIRSEQELGRVHKFRVASCGFGFEHLDWLYVVLVMDPQRVEPTDHAADEEAGLFDRPDTIV